jgi:hypothetical protein
MSREVVKLGHGRLAPRGQVTDDSNRSVALRECMQRCRPDDRFAEALYTLGVEQALAEKVYPNRPHNHLTIGG